ncbi:MAG: glycosyltransferase family 39 protein [Candidatus Daviesbacteria bacterium]|nr:MAG: glycosyltransferase family 39 protein [Candidatus Daviesbacteria bacterium]
MRLSKNQVIILLLILIGLIYRLILSSNNNFIFNMDNARDMVDVREMVVLQKPRLIGQTTSIEGLFYGPGWYYLLSIPFILSGGHPYAAILLEIFLWAVGGYFLLYLVNKFYGRMAMVGVAALWIASNYILLGSQYALNPNPILFLTPVFIFALWKYLETGKIWANLLAWFLAGIFFHFEVAVGVFMPVILLLTVILAKRWDLFKKKSFYLGVLVFLATFIPQILFNLKHGSSLVKAILDYKSTSHGDIKTASLPRIIEVYNGFYNSLLPTFMNFEFFTKLMTFLFPVTLLIYLKKFKKDNFTLITLLLLFVPLVGVVFLKLGLASWYLNEVLVVSIILVGFVFFVLQKISSLGKIISVILVSVLLIFAIKNMADYLKAFQVGDNGNSVLRNELAVVDYTYQKANGKNFKVYVYMPSVIDYPYQYLYWWRGLKKYGFVPKDYAYLPNKPTYISQKEKLNTGSNPPDSGLVFLIKEPDQIGQRHLWENSFKNLPLISTENIGVIIVETRQDLIQLQ